VSTLLLEDALKPATPLTNGARSMKRISQGSVAMTNVLNGDEANPSISPFPFHPLSSPLFRSKREQELEVHQIL